VRTASCLRQPIGLGTVTRLYRVVPAGAKHTNKHIYGVSYTLSVDDVFAVLSDPTRRRILEALRRRERSVMELVDRVGMHQPGVSRHLGVLREAGLVKVRKEAQRRQYSLVPGPLQELDAWLDHYRGLWDARFVKLANHLATRKRK